MKSNGSENGFTLMELMVVVAIVAVLAGLLSTAMVSIMRQAASSRTDNQIAQIHSAIMEYRHDFGHWPVPDGDIPQKYGGYWKLKYCSKGMGGCIADNSSVVEYLLETKATGAGRPKRDLLDIHGFSGVASTNTVSSADRSKNKSLIYEDWGDAWAMSKADDSGLHSKIPTLVWKDRQYRCPDCQVYSNEKRCKNTDCEYYKTHHAYRKLHNNDLRDVARPFYVMFDFTNDRVLVQRNPE